MDLGLAGKIAVVTGAASGMGRAVAILMAAEGVHVAAADVNAAGAGQTAADIAAPGGTCRAYALEVSERTSWQALHEQVRHDLGDVDILCNIAGPGARTGHLDTDDDEWRRQIDGHLSGVFLGCQTVLPGMIEPDRSSSRCA